MISYKIQNRNSTKTFAVVDRYATSASLEFTTLLQIFYYAEINDGIWTCGKDGWR